GCDVAAVRRGDAYLRPERVRAFVEVHIEQGPVLVDAGLPVGIVTGIRGCRRFRHGRCRGAYAHSGAVPRSARRDAVAATVALIHGLNQEWARHEVAGHDLTFTAGELTTDPALHGPSKVAGETRFVLDFRSLSDAVMAAMTEHAAALAAELGAAHRVEFDLGPLLYSEPAALDPALRRQMAALAIASQVATMELASGAGHDASVFANFGVPSAMLFVRNANGSHNPDEAMEMNDFADAARILAGFAVAQLR
ncbi:MAG: M20/M25/M40 family metallo-hydrolase, partial [Alphaproteobacteria bacterium]|nr:M20/M25/M40 family metallo-hydrolase [Alphaproteobacteria bacterium]